MTTERKNFTGQQTPKIIDGEYRNCNFSQPAPIEVVGKKVGVRIFPGDDTPRIFFECNLVNCQPPPGSTLTNCNTTLRESVVEVGTEDVTIDGRAVTIKRFADRIHGRTNPATLKPEYKPDVLEIQTDPPEGTRDAKIKRAVKERDDAQAEMDAKEAEAVELSR